MRQFQVYIRTYHGEPWVYGGAFDNAVDAWAAMLMVRARGCVAKVTGSTPVIGLDQDVLAVQQ